MKITFFTDLPLHVDAAQFADDGSFWRRCGNFKFVVESIQKCLDIITVWGIK